MSIPVACVMKRDDDDGSARDAHQSLKRIEKGRENNPTWSPNCHVSPRFLINRFAMDRAAQVAEIRRRRPQLFKCLPVSSNNDLVHGSWWIVGASLFAMLIPGNHPPMAFRFPSFLIVSFSTISHCRQPTPSLSNYQFVHRKKVLADFR